MQRVKIVTFVPKESAATVRQALGESGAGEIGSYSFCSFSVEGVGRFLPHSDAKPHVGSVGELEELAEERIEVICARVEAKKAIKALKRSSI